MGGGAVAGKAGKWVCGCGFDNFAYRQQCKTCGCDKPHASPAAPQQALAPVAGGPAAGAAAAKLVDSQPAVAEETPEQEVRGLENLIKHVKESAASATKDLILAGLLKDLQLARGKILQARPLPVRLQAAVTRQEAAAAAVKAAEAAEEQFRLIYLAKQRASAEARRKQQEADQEVGEVKALLGRPQLEAGAVAAVTVCLAMLKQHGMGEEQLASFDSALRFAFGGCPATAGAASPFAVGAPAPAGMEAVAAGAAPTTPSPNTPFTQGGSFASTGLSPFPGMGPASAGEQAQRRAEALASLKLRLEAQKLKHGTVGMEAKGLREAAKKAAEAGGDNVEETEQLAFAKEREADMEKALVEALESQRNELESEAFAKSPERKQRDGPF